MRAKTTQYCGVVLDVSTSVLPGDDDPRGLSIRTWLEAHPNATARELAESGYVAPHWPEPYGLNADPLLQLIVDDEFRSAGVARPSNPIGIGWAGPTILFAGSEAQKKRYLPPMLAAEEIWCQLFSEPQSGSDLASLGTKAVRDGDEWIINGQKIWTSGAHESQFGILIARTDTTMPKHRGITYFICPMDTPGIEIRGITSMAGAASFNEVFFTDVRIPHENVVGEVNDGWRLAKVTLGNERVSLSSGGVLWGMGPSAADLVAIVRREGGVRDAVMRQHVAALYTEHVILELIRARTLTARLRGEQPGPEASIRKIIADEHGQRTMMLARDLIGPDAMLVGPVQDSSSLNARSWYSGFLFSRALTIGGGTGEVQRNIIGEKVLGLPAEPDSTIGVPYSSVLR